MDDVNNRRHDPIGLEQVWHTKWWPTRQFTFICSVAEANALQSRARAMDETPTPQLEFRRALAMKMLNNNIRVDGVTVGAPMRRRKRALALDFCEHRLCTCPPFTGGWKNADNYCLKVKSEYMKTKCAHCEKKGQDPLQRRSEGHPMLGMLCGPCFGARQHKLGRY